MANIESIFRPEELQKARAEVLSETAKELAVFARRSNEPVKRVALAELEQVLKDTQTRWIEAGLVAPQSATAA